MPMDYANNGKNYDDWSFINTIIQVILYEVLHFGSFIDVSRIGFIDDLVNVTDEFIILLIRPIYWKTHAPNVSINGTFLKW